MIYLGADHGGYDLKEKVKQYLTTRGEAFTDLGNTELDPDDDYPQYAQAVAQKVTAEPDSKGILLCRSGTGMCIAANKVAGVRAFVPLNVAHTQKARAHNDTNVLCLAGDYGTWPEQQAIIKAWLDTSFSQESRHQRRVNQIDQIIR